MKVFVQFATGVRNRTLGGFRNRSRRCWGSAGGLCSRGDLGSDLGGGSTLSGGSNVNGSCGLSSKSSLRNSSSRVDDLNTLCLDAAAADSVAQSGVYQAVCRNDTGEEICRDKSRRGGGGGAGGICFAQGEEGCQVGGDIETGGAENGGRGQGGLFVCGRCLHGCGAGGSSRGGGTAGPGVDADGDGDNGGDEVGGDYCERV